MSVRLYFLTFSLNLNVTTTFKAAILLCFMFYVLFSETKQKHIENAKTNEQHNRAKLFNLMQRKEKKKKKKNKKKKT